MDGLAGSQIALGAQSNSARCCFPCDQALHRDGTHGLRHCSFARGAAACKSGLHAIGSVASDELLMLFPQCDLGQGRLAAPNLTGGSSVLVGAERLLFSREAVA